MIIKDASITYLIVVSYLPIKNIPLIGLNLVQVRSLMNHPTERSKKFRYDAFEKDMLLSFLVRDISFYYSCINSSREEGKQN